ncbi:MAG: hypothetical protein NTY13_00100, partial [Chlamydiae bacterium]|nr:hypothetical protein [Chlamydiota bacterium]
MNPFNRFNPQGPPSTADHPLSFSETLLYVSQVACLALGVYRALQGAREICALLSGRVSRFPVIPNIRRDLSRDLDAWVATQGPCKEVAHEVKNRILECYLNDTFELDISGSMISSLPSCLANFNLKELNCRRCPLLTLLPDLPNCSIFNCHECPLLDRLPALPNCHFLDCSYCPLITLLPHLPICRFLDCRECPLLTALPDLPNCTALDCHECPLITRLPALASCSKLICSRCPLLTLLPDLPSCHFLDCSRCPLLTLLPDLPSCTFLNCSRCPLLTLLPDLPSCISLKCSRCPLLTLLPALPSCITLNCSWCPLLSRPPAALHPSASVVSHGCLLLNLEARVVPNRVFSPGD